jgi:predicted DCC family thiol-disulfide oxidoreductase YuxK
MSDGREILLVYDKECPACNYYCRLARIRETVGDLKLVDAREPGSTMVEITAAGLDIDQGMVLIIGDEMHYGSDAIHMLAMLGTRTGFFNRLSYHVFRSKRVSRVLYPIFRSSRNLLLKILRKTKINNLDIAGNERF